MSTISLFGRFLAYETWATGLTLASIDTVPVSARGTMQYTRALQVMAHVQLARSMWLARLGGGTESVHDWFPAWTTSTTRERAAELHSAWRAYLGTLTDAGLASNVQYRSADGSGFESRVEDLIAHVFNHSTYHRGQVARLVTEAGGKRAATDLVAMTRTSV